MTELDAFASRAASMMCVSFVRRSSTLGVELARCVALAGGVSAFAVIVEQLAGVGDEIAPCLRSKATAQPLAIGPVAGNEGEPETEPEDPSAEGDDAATLGSVSKGGPVG